jgi:hypothetical protein
MSTENQKQSILTRIKVILNPRKPIVPVSRQMQDDYRSSPVESFEEMKKAFAPQNPPVQGGPGADLSLKEEAEKSVMIESGVVAGQPGVRVIPLKIRMRTRTDPESAPASTPVVPQGGDTPPSPVPGLIEPEQLPVRIELASGPVAEEEGRQEILDRPHPIDNGTILNRRFKIMGLIKEDSQRRVYLGIDMTSIQGPVKVYELRRPRMDQDTFDERMKKVQKILRNLSIYKHPHAAEVRSSFLWEGRFLYVLDYTSGMNLNAILSANLGPLAEEEAADIGIALCDALEFMQFRGVPFFPERTDAADIIISEKGVLKISKYNLHLIFDPYRATSLMPRKQEHYFDFITWVSRIVFFMLTGKEYGDNKETRNFLKKMGKNIAQVMDMTCRPGQKAVGDIRVLRKMLEKAPIRTKDSSKDILKFAWKFMKAG